MDSPDTSSLLERLAALVVKRGVTLGNLGDADRTLVLALAATVLPVGAGQSEPEVNEALRRGLQAEAAFIDTDHVELRRWLVDTGFWRRDGFGRRYERVPADELPAAGSRAAAVALNAIDPAAWVIDVQARQAAQREARRAAWQARPGAADG